MTRTLTAAPRQVFCVLAGAGRDITVADDAVAGAFDVAGERLVLGASPDWTVDPYPADKEWRIEWVKFYYGLDLAHACALTGEARYADAWARLVTTFVAQVPAASDDSEVMARRIQNWIYAWNRFQVECGHPGLPADVAPAVVEYLWVEVRHLRAHLTAERNHRTLELYALLVAALAFPELDADGALRDFAFESLHENLLADMRPDGVHREHSTHYHCIVLRSFLGALKNARLTGVTLPASYIDRVTRAAEFAMHAHRPDGAIPACADSDSESYRDVLALAGELLDRPDFVWAATQGAAGRPPLVTAASFPEGGYYLQRGGWGVDRPFTDDTFLIFDAGALGDGGHGHYDALSVEVASGGRPLLVDPGRFTYAEGAPNWRHWFKGTAAHNTVTVDGLDQTPYRRRKPKGPVATARLLVRATSTRVDLLMGETSSPAYDARHRRAVLHVVGEYWIVADHVAAPVAHDYQVRWHLAPDVGQGVSIDVGASRVEAEGVALVFAPVGPVHLEDGWYAPRYGVKAPAPVVAWSGHAATTTVVTVIDPRPWRRRGAGMHVDVVSPGNGDHLATRVEVRGVGPSGDGTDVLTWTARPAPLSVPGFTTTGCVAWVRMDERGRVVASDAATAAPVGERRA